MNTVCVDLLLFYSNPGCCCPQAIALKRSFSFVQSGLVRARKHGVWLGAKRWCCSADEEDVLAASERASMLRQAIPAINTAAAGR
jgi:hypothetical protein